MMILENHRLHRVELVFHFWSIKKPTPLGPLNLWAEADNRSTPSSLTSIWTWPTACTVSVWNKVPFLWAISHSSFIGWNAPNFVVCYITETSFVEFVMDTFQFSRLNNTLPCNTQVGHRNTHHFCRFTRIENGVVFYLWCNYLRLTLLKVSPLIAQLSRSVPPEVK